MSDQANAGSVAAEQPAGNPATPPPVADNGSAANGAKSWLDGLSEGNRKLADTKGWTTPESLDKAFTSYAELERQQGAALKVPAPDAPKEEWEKFHERLPEDFRPVKSADQIEYARPADLPENFRYSEELANASKQWAVEAGASPKVAKAYHDNMIRFTADQVTAQNAAIAQSVETTHDALVKDWGPPNSDAYKVELEGANRAIKKLDLVDVFKEKGILLQDGALTDPKIAKALSAISKSMFMEDSLADAGISGGVNPFKKDASGARNLTAISALVKSDPERAKRMAREAGENPDIWVSSNPL